MPAGAYQPTTTPATNPFVLRVGGADHVVTAKVPVGEGDGINQARITETSDGPNRFDFTIEDPSNAVASYIGGELVELIDRRSGSERALFGGRLTEWTYKARPSGRGRFITCSAMGYEAWLDWRCIWPSWSSRVSRDGQVTRLFSDRTIIQVLVDRFGGHDLSAPPTTVDDTTPTQMDLIRLGPMTLREAFDRVAEACAFDDTETRRRYYVDNIGRVHWYKDSENDTAPYRIADGSYTRDVLTTSGLVSYWPIRVNDSGTTEHDGMGYANGTYNGTVTAETTKAGIPNEPEHWVSWRFDGSDSYISASGANLHPGNTFTVEFWVRRHTTGSAQTVWSGGSGDVEIGFDASDKLIVYRENVGNHFVSAASYTSTTEFIHVMVTREPADTDVYVNGVDITSAGTTTARTFVAGSGTVEIGRRKTSTDRYYSGHIASVAVYSTKKSAAVALAHYNQGYSITPEGLTLTRSAFDGREVALVRGSRAAGHGSGTGDVRLPEANNTSGFGRNNQLARQEIIEREDSQTKEQRRRYGRGFLRAHNDPELSGYFTVVGYDGWRVGQLLHITDTATGASDLTAEIKEIETDVGYGAGILTYTIWFGRTRRSGARDQSRRRRGR